MAILNFLLHLAGATMLLLFAVRMVRTGIERSFGASFRRILTDTQSLVGAAGAGLGLAIVLQSSAAVALLVAGFSAGGTLGFNTGLAVVLGGDLGSALIIQVLSFKLDWLIPLLLTVGGWLFVKTEQKRWRQIGRIMMGVAFILIALQLLREAMDPIRESAFLPAISAYLARDFLTAFLVGAALAFVMHSSVATILMCVTLVAIDAIPLAAGLSLVLGANLGSAVIPLWLTRGMSGQARQVLIANLVLRGSWALLMLFVVNLFPITDYLLFMGAAQALISTHIAFNLSLLLVTLPFIKSFGPLAEQLLPSDNDAADEEVAPISESISALDHSVIANSRLALPNLKREILRMSELVQRMAEPTMEVYGSGDIARIDQLIALDQQVNKSLSGVRRYLASLTLSKWNKADAKAARQMAEYAISLETAGNIVSKQLLPLAKEKAKKNLRFSPAGWAELRSMHETVMANMRMASNVLVSDDVESARLLVSEKSEISRLERKSRKRHLKRLAEGGASFETSDIHLETIRGLRDLNSQCAAIAYPLLYRSGQLLETRLIEIMDDDDTSDD